MTKPGHEGASTPSTLLIPAILLLVFCLAPMVEGIIRMLANGELSRLSEPEVRTQLSALLSNRVLALTALSLSTATIATMVAIPLAYRLASASRWWRAIFLLVVLIGLAMSEPMLELAATTFAESSAFYNSSLLSRQAVAMAGMLLRALPLAILILYPAFRQVDPRLLEVARTMGASPARVLSTLVLPMERGAIAGAWLAIFIFALGSFLLAQLHDAPHHWTLIVLDHEPGLSVVAAVVALVLLATLSAIAMWMSSTTRGASRG